MKNRPWLQAVAILLLAMFPALTAAFFHPKRPAWSRETLAKDEVTLAMAQAMPGVVWVDARTANFFTKEHIPGAILLNEDDWNALLLTFAMQFSPERTIVVYCDSLECNASHAVAERLRKELGAQKVFVLKGGWQSWKAAKITTTSIEVVLRWLLGGLFLFAGGLKALDPSEFANDIANYQLLPWSYAVGTALYLPWLEIFAGGMLIFGPWRSGALRILLFLMLAFLQALVTAWLRGLNIHCGCFGRAFATSNYALLFLRDLTILAGFCWLFLQEWKHRIAEENLAENV